MPLLIDRPYLVEYQKDEDLLLHYANHDEAAIAEAIDVASRDAVAAMRRSRRYTAGAIDALTPATASPDLKDRVAARAMDRLTRSDAGRPASIADAAEEARTWFSWVATGNVVIEGIATISRRRVRGASPTKHYFRDDCDEE